MISWRRLNQARALLGAALMLGVAGLVLKAALPDPLKMADLELNNLVEVSTLTFTGTVTELNNSYVPGIGPSDFPIIAQVDSVVWADPQVLKTFGDLKGAKLTVALNPVSRIVMQKKNMPAVFFADPLIYDEYIGVVATAVPIPDTKEDFLNKLHAAAVQKSEAPLRIEIASADLIVAGQVESIRPLPAEKAAGLRSANKGLEVRSEHRPRWAEAIIKVQSRLKPADKNLKEVNFVSVIFPRGRSCFTDDSPQFSNSELGIWLLQLKQLDEQERKVLLTTEIYKGTEIQSYTALRSADFQDLTDAMLSKIRQIVAETKEPK
jgi:hypothetical protein